MLQKAREENVGQIEPGKPLRTKSVREVARALATLLTHWQESGAPGSSKDLAQGDGHPLIPKEGRGSLNHLSLGISPVLTICRHGDTKVLS